MRYCFISNLIAFLVLVPTPQKLHMLKILQQDLSQDRTATCVRYHYTTRDEGDKTHYHHVLRRKSAFGQTVIEILGVQDGF